MGFAIAMIPLITRVLGRVMTDQRAPEAVSAPINQAAVRRVLVIRLDEIGDAVMNVPLLRALRAHYPAAHITAVVRPEAYSLLETCPYIDALHAIGDTTSGALRVPARYLNMLSFARRQFSAEHFDLAVVPRWEVDRYFAVCLAYLSGARWRVGYSETVSDEKRLKNRGWDRLLTHPVRGGQGVHEVQRALGIAEVLGADTTDDRLEIWPTPEDEQHVEDLLQEAGLDEHNPLVALMPGAALGRRRWPLERFSAVGRELAQHDGVRLVALGGPGDRALGAALKASSGGWLLNATGRLGLRQTAALLGRCRLYIGNDTGPMHIAAAMGTPVVEISCHPRSGDPEHHNAPQRFGPWGVPARIVQPETPRPPCEAGCAYDDPHCILEVTTDEVLCAARHLLRAGTDQQQISSEHTR